MDPSIPDVSLERLQWGALVAWLVWQRLQALTESQKAQGKRIGDLEDRAARLEGKGDGR